MQSFKVVRVIDGDTFDVEPRWEWGGQIGARVRPTKFDAPEINTLAGQSATRKLVNLLLGQYIHLKSAKTIDRGRLVCDVYFNGRHLADYFPEYSL